MIAISQAVSAALLHFIWQGTAVAFLLWIALLLLRNRTPGARYAASCAALTLMAALPAATAWFLYERPVSLSASIAFIIPPASRAVSSSPLEWLAFVRQWILPLWAFGVALFAIRLALAWRHVMLLRRAAKFAEGGIWEAASLLSRRMRVTRPVRVLVSKLADAPSVIGWLRPAILLPAAALAGLDVAQLEAILAHELAHIRRHDYLVNMLQTIVETLLFYHPAVWWASSRMRHERELCCDDLAVRHCGDAIGYARALTKLERMRVVPEPAVAANGGALLYRIQRLTGAVRECAPSRMPVILALLAAALCVPLAVHRAGAQQQSAPSPHVFLGEHPTTNVFFDAPAGAELGSTDVQGDVIAVEYPEDAVRQGITGAVLVEATLAGDGRAVDARVVTGPLELRKAALRGVLEGRFVNATAGEVRQVTLTFGPKELAAARARLEQRGVAVTLSDGRLTVTAGREGAQERMLKQTAETESFLREELEQARKQLAEAANQPELEAQLKAQIANQERTLAITESVHQRASESLEQVRRELEERERNAVADAANQTELEAQQKAKLAEEQKNLAIALGDLQSKLEEANLAASSANQDATQEQWKARAMILHLDALQRQLANEQRVYTDVHPEVRALKEKIAEMQQVVIKFVAGRKLVRIDGDALPSSFHLPVQLGDTLTEDSMSATTSAVNAFDRNLEVVFFPVNGWEAAIRILRR
jgi:beta-lactamase regulating signal transducer with metallopeptidase domain